MDRPLIIPLFVKRDFPTFFSHIPINMEIIRYFCRYYHYKQVRHMEKAKVYYSDCVPPLHPIFWIKWNAC